MSIHREKPALFDPIEYYRSVDVIADRRKLFDARLVSTPHELLQWKKTWDRLLPREARGKYRGIATDVFVWQAGKAQRPSVPETQIGGHPWREEDRPWPTNAQGRPLQFIAQFDFGESKDLLETPPPDDILCIYGLVSDHYLSLDEESIALEWNPRELATPCWGCPNGCSLSHVFGSRRARIVQYPTFEHDEVRCQMQATLIGQHAHFPQGDPELKKNESLVCVLSSAQFDNPWPLYNCERLPPAAAKCGMSSALMIADVGVMAVVCVDGKNYEPRLIF